MGLTPEQKAAWEKEKYEYAAKHGRRQVENMSNEVKCPSCGSTQISAGNKGFGLGKAAAGGILLGPVGLLGGLVGSKKVMVTCLNCGKQWKAGSV